MADLTVASYLQGPLGEAIRAADGPGTLPTPTFAPAVTLTGTGAPPLVIPGPPMALLGPGHVAAVTADSIVRVDPPAGAVDVEPNYLAVVELIPAELPWLLTPARAANGRLRPWMVLVVVVAASTPLLPGGPPFAIDADVAELPDLGESWAWAHVQRTSGGGALPGGGTAAAESLARLVCPRRLQPGVTYRACLVPAFSSGVAAGLGEPVAADAPHAPAWDVGQPGRVRLPVLHSWTFTTGPLGDFEQLVRRLRPADPAALHASSARIIDVQAPWPDTAPAAELRLVGVRGALIPLDADPEPEPRLTAGELAEFQARIRAQVDAPAARVGRTEGDTTGSLAPPLYGGPHVSHDILAQGPEWLAQLNTSIGNRLAAGLGADYVRVHQEALMARAWEQVGAIREANRRRAVVELTTEVAEKVHARHVAALEPGELVALAAPAAARARTSDSTTLALEIRMSRMVDGAGSTAFARRLRPRGALARSTGVSVRELVPRALDGRVAVPAGAPVIPPSPMVSASGVPAVAATATARQLVTLTALARVAALNDDVAGGAALSTRVARLELGAGLAESLAAGGVSAVATAIADTVSAVSGATSSVLADMTSGLQDFGAVSVLGVPIADAALAGRVAASLSPGDSHHARLASQLAVPARLTAAGPAGPVMAHPDFPVPTALALREADPEWLMPGLGSFPTNSVALLRQNAAFIESYLTGMNTELMRELLWREFPTDRRGTPFRRFWPRPDGAPDIPPIATWTDPAPLGARLTQGDALAVVLVRGDVLRRYPGTVVTAVRSAPPDQDRRLQPDSGSRAEAPLFALPVDEATTAYAFAIPVAELRAPAADDAPGWFFVFSEHGYRIRFGFDEPPARRPPQDGPEPPPAAPEPPPVLTTWGDAAWPPPEGLPDATSVPVVRGHASAGTGFGPSGEPGPDVPAWGRDSADTARITLQRPARVAIHAGMLLLPPAAVRGGG